MFPPHAGTPADWDRWPALPVGAVLGKVLGSVDHAEEDCHRPGVQLGDKGFERDVYVHCAGKLRLLWTICRNLEKSIKGVYLQSLRSPSIVKILKQLSGTHEHEGAAQRRGMGRCSSL